MVYEGEEKSQDVCRCTRPKTSYKRVRGIALEHRIVNTVVLRSVCKAFHAWALHEILRNHIMKGNINPELEVDFSSITRLTTKLAPTADCIVPRLVEDFPALKNSGVTIYLGDPGGISNMRTVVHMLRESKVKVFSGVIFWDVNSFNREYHPEFKNLLDKALNEGDVVRISETRHRRGTLVRSSLSQSLLDAWSDFCYRMESEDRRLFISLISQLALGQWEHSKVHIAQMGISNLLAREPEMGSLASLTRGCKTLVFREFERFIVFHWLTVKDIIESQTVEWLEKHPSPGNNPHIMIGDLQDEFMTAANEFEASMNDNSQSNDVREPLATSKVEFNRLVSSEVFSNISPSFQNLETCVITGGWPWTDNYLGDILYALLPSAKTLRKFIYRPWWDRTELHEAWPDVNRRHPCVLLQKFSNLTELEVYSRLCTRLFDDTGGDDVKVQQRHWLFDTLGPCPDSCANPKPWDPESIEKLTQYCREWRDRHDMTSRELLKWNVDLHITLPMEESRERKHDRLEFPVLDANAPLCDNHTGKCNTISLLA